jgi:putative phosphotransacetylase
MDSGALKKIVRNTVLSVFAGQGKYYFPVAVSARHVHLSQKHFESLFGQGKIMTHYRDLSQPGQFACGEMVELTGLKGSISKVRVLGPPRSETQVEISVSDSFTLGIKPDIRMSGDITGTPGCSITGPLGKITIDRGVIVAARHVHLSEEQAAAYGIKNGDVISLKVPPPRQGIIENIVARVGKEFDLEVHFDTDEANGNSLSTGAILVRCNI